MTTKSVFNAILDLCGKYFKKLFAAQTPDPSNEL